MINLHSRGIIAFFEIYVAVAIIIAAIITPLAMSIIPILLFIWYLVLWQWSANAFLNMLTEYFMFFVLALLFSPLVGPLFSLFISLPVLLLINHGLVKNAESSDFKVTRYAYRPTNIFLVLLWIAVVVLGISLLFGSLSILLAGAAIIGYLGILGAFIWRQLSSPPVEAEQIQLRIVAGAEATVYIRLTTKTKIGGLLFLESPYEWLEVSPNMLSLKERELLVKVSLSPVLSGPSIIRLRGKATDRWGLIQSCFELEPIRLNVIPRARYAAWLAEKYLAKTGLGAMPMISNIEAVKATYGLRRGIEYYGSRLYQPGDSLKNIDWKHSFKYNELISKEFAEFHDCPALILINLAVSNVEEADKLAYNIVVTALSLAREGISAALAVYDHESVKVTTPMLQPAQLVSHSLQVSQEIVNVINPVRYLNSPDVARLRANMSRLRLVGSHASGVLAQLLQLEYKSLSYHARFHPVTKALAMAFGKVDKRSNIVIISLYNHDAEALAFHTFSFANNGSVVITI